LSLLDLVAHARNKQNFSTIEDYLAFACQLVNGKASYIQAEIVCQNETDYRFWQLPIDARFAISRPINSTLLCTVNEIAQFQTDMLGDIHRRDFMTELSQSERALINKVIYTCQQSIGVVLDALPANESNFARKLNGDLFERQIQLWIKRMGVECSAATVRVPVLVDGVKQCEMNFQHDLVVRSAGDVKIIGSVKTSSKDRIGKIFVDKMLLKALTGEAVPQIAIFLNDVQRGKKSDQSYKVSSTFLPGHFKAYTIKVNPLDGVYYCDLRPNMKIDSLLSSTISQIDNFFCEEIWSFLDRQTEAVVEIADDQALS
jgi:hypothetical protein